MHPNLIQYHYIQHYNNQLLLHKQKLLQQQQQQNKVSITKPNEPKVLITKPTQEQPKVSIPKPIQDQPKVAENNQNQNQNQNQNPKLLINELDGIIKSGCSSISNNVDYIINTQNELINKLYKLKNHKLILWYLNNLKTIKVFTSIHNCSESVVLLEGFIVKKKCEQHSYGNYLFNNEVKSLSQLSGFPHFPKLIAYDQSTLTIYMTYCGELISNTNFPSDLSTQINEIYEILSSMDVNPNDMLLRNTCCLGNELKIIDFSFNNDFGKTVKETINDFIRELSTIRKIDTNILKTQESNDNNHNNDNNDNSYIKYYPNWRNKIEIYKTRKELLLKKQLEFIQYKKNVINGKIKIK